MADCGSLRVNIKAIVETQAYERTWLALQPRERREEIFAAACRRCRPGRCMSDPQESWCPALSAEILEAMERDRLNELAAASPASSDAPASDRARRQGRGGR